MEGSVERAVERRMDILVERPAERLVERPRRLSERSGRGHGEDH